MRYSLSVRFALTIAALLFPVASLAATTESFDFSAPPHARWQVQGWTGVRQTGEGLSVETSKDGAWVMTLPSAFRAQTVRLTTSAAKTTSALILWDKRDGGTEMIQLPLTIEAGTEPRTQSINLTRYPEWNPGTKRFGLALPAGSRVTLHGMELVRYSLLERAAAAARSLTRTDRFQAFSINFLWGPLVAFTPEELAHLYEGQPPSSWSLMRFVFLLLVAASLAAAFLRRTGRTLLLATFCSLWIVLDVLMGAELTGYALHDWNSYLRKPVSERVFRDREHYYSTMEQSAPWLMQEPSFGFLSSWPVLGSVRYFTFPSRPLTPDDAGSMDVKRWLVFSEPRGSIGDDGRLLLKGVPISPPGRVVKSFGTGSFLFEVP